MHKDIIVMTEKEAIEVQDGTAGLVTIGQQIILWILERTRY